jgi:short subunit fatty acids transporter
LELSRVIKLVVIIIIIIIIIIIMIIAIIIIQHSGSTGKVFCTGFDSLLPFRMYCVLRVLFSTSRLILE